MIDSLSWDEVQHWATLLQHLPVAVIATDAAREGLNLQAHCWNLFHFDVPWNPSRMEQRNGRIDRKLQPRDTVYCHYFILLQRPEDRVLQVLLNKSKTIRNELGIFPHNVSSCSPVVVGDVIIMATSNGVDWSHLNIPAPLAPALIMVDHLKEIWIDAELDVADTPVYYNRVFKKDYAVALNLTGSAVDDPDVVFFEGYACGSLRNYNNYCDPEMTKLFQAQSRETDHEKRLKMVWDIDKKLQEDGARPVIQHDQGATCWRPEVKGVKLSVNTIYNHWRFEDVWLDR